MPNWKRPLADCWVILAFMVHDLGWSLDMPSVGLPAIIAAFFLQAYVTKASLSVMGVHLVHQVSILVWFIGNALWTIADWIWGGERPAGFFSNLELINSLSRSWYVPIMVAADCLMIPAAVLLVAYHIHRVVVAKWQPIPVAYAFVPCLPLHVYYELFIVPWIVMDSCWGVMNLRELLSGETASRRFVILSAAIGCMAIAIETDCLRRHCRDPFQRRRDVAMVLAELLWVSGNMLWMLGEFLWESPATAPCTICFFMGIALATCATLAPQRQLTPHSSQLAGFMKQPTVDPRDPECMASVRSIPTGMHSIECSGRLPEAHYANDAAVAA